MSEINKDWKDFLLSSGLPLEYSIKNILYKLKYGRLNEYNYMRPNENGLNQNFSVDIEAFDLIYPSYENSPPISAYYLIECKYRHPSTKWIFSPYTDESYDLHKLIYDDYQLIYNVDNEKINKIFSKYQFVSKGIELLNKDKNPKGIEQSIFQLSYAQIHKHINYLETVCANDIAVFNNGSISPFMIIPIVVTTSELWRMDENTSIEAIKKSKNIEEIATMEDILIYKYFPDNLMSNYFLDKFKNMDTELQQCISKIQNERSDGMSLNESIISHSKEYPNTIFIMNYKSFEKQFLKLSGILANASYIE